MTEYFTIGKLVATFGLQGEIVLQHNLGKKTALKGLEALFIEETKNSFIPYFISSTKIKSETETLLKLEGIETKEAAKKLTPKLVWLTQADFEKYAAKAAPISMLGFILVDVETEIGKIVEVIEQPHQILCTVIVNNKEALIPVHADNIIKIDKKNKQVIVELPEGLLEIYQ